MEKSVNNPQFGNINAGLRAPEVEEQTDVLWQSGGLTVERIVSNGHCSEDGFWYDQEQDEWVMVVAGQATLEFADDRRKEQLKAGDYCFIPAHCRHRVSWTRPDEATVWLAIHHRPTAKD